MAGNIIKWIGGFIIIVFLVYFLIALYLPKEKSPLLSYEGAKLKSIFENYDGRFISLQIEKYFNKKESNDFINKYNEMNNSFTRKDLTILVGFDYPMIALNRVESLISIDRKDGRYASVNESYYDPANHLVNYVSSDDRETHWIYIEEGSDIDSIASKLCPSSRY